MTTECVDLIGIRASPEIRANRIGGCLMGRGRPTPSVSFYRRLCFSCTIASFLSRFSLYRHIPQTLRCGSSNLMFKSGVLISFTLIAATLASTQTSSAQGWTLKCWLRGDCGLPSSQMAFADEYKLSPSVYFQLCAHSQKACT